MRQVRDEVHHEFAPGLQSVVLVKLRHDQTKFLIGDPV